MAAVYDYLDYRDYLNAWISSRPGGGHGIRKKIADSLRCQSAFVSQVLHKDAHLSLEHGFKLSEFLDHGKDEADFFVLLLLYQRAGSEDVRKYFHAKINAVLKERQEVQKRLRKSNPLSAEDQSRYYSAWYHPVIRLLVAIPGCRTKDAIVARLKLPAATVSSAIEFLLRTGFLVERDGELREGVDFTFLSPDSPERNKHYTNWHLLALNSLSLRRENDFHYAGGVTLSKKDVILIRTMLVDFIEKLYKDVVMPSPSETLCGICFDWFEM